MDQKCVICKSATYHQHDALTYSLRKQFWQMIPMYLFMWSSWDPNNPTEENPPLLACTRIQGEVMKTIIFHEHTIQYSPSNRYVASFLKKYIEKIERVPEYELDDELIEFYVGLAATTNLAFAPTGLCYKTYTLDKEQYTRVVLQEEQAMLSHGSTGLVTWECGLRLADFFIEHPDIIRGKNVVELGAGCGLTGFVCAAMGASHVLSTDCDGKVLNLLQTNRKANPEISDKIQVHNLDWANVEECSSAAKDVDVIIGADVTYDPTILTTLVNAIKTMVVSSQQVVYLTAVVRNPETFEQFLETIDQTDTLVKSVMSLNDTRMNLLCHPSPLSDIRLLLITHK